MKIGSQIFFFISLRIFGGKMSSHSDDNDKSRSMMDYNKPDESKGGYYCKLCNAHMNNLSIWETHVAGKRHVTNVKKAPGEALSKVKFVCIEDEPMISEKLRDLSETVLVVGLQFTCETRRANRKIPPFYSCNLYQGTFPTEAFLEHLASFKHRSNYCRKVEPTQVRAMENLSLKECMLEPLINQICEEKLDEYGPGKMDIKAEKSHEEVVMKYDTPKSVAIRSWLSKSSKGKRFNLYDHEPILPPRPVMKDVEAPPRMIKLEKYTPLSSAVSKPESTSSPKREWKFDLKRDAKYLNAEQRAAVIDTVIEIAEEKGTEACIRDPDMMHILKRCLKIMLGAFLRHIYKNASPELKERMKYLFSEEGRRERLERK